MNQILDAVTEHQKTFLNSGKEEDLDLTQDRLAANLGVHPSTVCRAVASKAILTPWGMKNCRYGIFSEEDRSMGISA